MKILYTAAALAVMAVPAAASTITVEKFSADKYKSMTSNGIASAYESFEGYGVGNVDNGFSTAVGSFSTIGGTGTGGTVTRSPFDNDGTMLTIRDGNLYGRRSTTQYLSGDSSDNQFLDSNDTHGIAYKASMGGELFNKIVLTVTDAAEFGNTMLIEVMGMSYEVESRRGSLKRTVKIKFDEKVTMADITFSHFRGDNPRVNDGFSIDDVSVSEVPLPASALLLLGGIGGLAAMRRRKS